VFDGSRFAVVRETAAGLQRGGIPSALRAPVPLPPLDSLATPYQVRRMKRYLCSLKKDKKFVALCDLRDYDTQNQFYAARDRHSLRKSPLRERSWDCVKLMIDWFCWCRRPFRLLVIGRYSLDRKTMVEVAPQLGGSKLPVTGLTALVGNVKLRRFFLW
jgi:hypothetical protein